MPDAGAEDARQPGGALPPGWAWARLKDLTDLKGGLTKGQRRRAGALLRSVPYLRVANVQRGFLDLREVKEIEATEEEIAELRLRDGDVLFNEGGDRDKLGRGWIWSDQLPECIHQNHVFRARLASDELSPRYISWYGNAEGQSYFIQQGKQTTNLASLNLTKLGELPVKVPPAPEQRRIVAAIEEQFTRLAAAVAALQRVRANLKRYRAAVLQAAVGGHLVPTEAELARVDGRSYETGGQLLMRIGATAVGRGVLDALGPIPEGWTWTYLSAVTDLKGGLTKGQRRRASDALRMVPYLRVANVQRGYLDLTEVKFIEATEQEITDLRLQGGDVLFNEGGDRDKLGRGWVWREELPECIHQNHVFRARPRSSELESKYLSWYGNSSGQRYFLEQGKQTTNLASINLRKLGALPVPVPPLAEQRRIVAEVECRLSVVEELEQTVETNLKRADRLRQAILKRAFEGRLVPQDPTDEPATVLLACIHAQRAAPTPNTAHCGRRTRARPAYEQAPLGV